MASWRRGHRRRIPLWAFYGWNDAAENEMSELKKKFHTTIDTNGVLTAIDTALTSALTSPIVINSLKSNAPDGAWWSIWPKAKERESGDRVGFYSWFGSIYGDLLDETDATAKNVLWSGQLIAIEIRDFEGMAPTRVILTLMCREALGLIEYIINTLDKSLPVETTIDRPLSEPKVSE